MKIADYLNERQITDEAFAVTINRDRSTVWRLRNGSRPSPDLMAVIAEKTNGAVLPNDFFDLPDTAAAA